MHKEINEKLDELKNLLITDWENLISEAKQTLKETSNIRVALVGGKDKYWEFISIDENDIKNIDLRIIVKYYLKMKKELKEEREINSSNRKKVEKYEKISNLFE